MANLSNTLDTNNISSKEAAYAEISSKLDQAQQRYKQIDDIFEKNKKKLTLEDLKTEYAYRKKAERELESWKEKKLLARQLLEKSFSDEQYKRELAAALSRVDEETRLKEESDNRIQQKRDKWISTVTQSLTSIFSTGTKIWDNAEQSFKNQVKSAEESFLNQQQAMAWALTGSNASKSVDNLRDALEGVSRNILGVLGNQGTVKTQQVYENYGKLIKEGILYNAEQRAFLQTLADDLGGIFNATDGSLIRLINLQRTDLTDERLAIQTSLKTFLNQNYETSQYIKDGFTEVSNALLEAQATMTARSGMQLEAVIQQWMGSLSSVGMSNSAVTSLANALGLLGSGNISALTNDKMFNLIAMGITNSGLDFGSIATQGLSAEEANALMKGIVSTIISMTSEANNVTRAELANVFGLSVSDIKAASQVGDVTGKGVVGTDISDFLRVYGDLLHESALTNNYTSNLAYDTGMGVVMDGDYYRRILRAELTADNTSSILSSLLGLGGAGLGAYIGGAIGNVPGAIVGSILSSLLSAAGSWAGGKIGTELSYASTGTFEYYSDIINNTKETLEKMYSVQIGAKSALKLYNDLRSGDLDRNQYIRATGMVDNYSRTSGISTSGSVIVGETNQLDVASQNYLASKEYQTKVLENAGITEYGVTDLYNLIKEAVETTIPGNSYATVTRISESANTVTIGNDLSYIQDMISLASVNIQNIYNLLIAWSGRSAETYNAGDFMVNSPLASQFGLSTSTNNAITGGIGIGQ